MTNLLNPSIQGFKKISLSQLNKYSSLLDREENKYILNIDQFVELIPNFQKAFNILAIADKTIFTYRSLYFDSDEMISYKYHNQGRTKRRFKIRIRHYLGSNLCYFEIKLKNKRDGTIKKRIPYKVSDYGVITSKAQKFLEDTYFEVYGVHFDTILEPKVEVIYNRITLVSKKAQERITFDFNLIFNKFNSNFDKSSDVKTFIIAETKTLDGKGISDSIFRTKAIKTQSCSKYCLGANLLNYNIKYNRFKPLIKLYNALPSYSDTNIYTSTQRPINYKPSSLIDDYFINKSKRSDIVQTETELAFNATS